MQYIVVSETYFEIDSVSDWQRADLCSTRT